jgi:hypothetical protein
MTRMTAKARLIHAGDGGLAPVGSIVNVERTKSDGWIVHTEDGADYWFTHTAPVEPDDWACEVRFIAGTLET